MPSDDQVIGCGGHRHPRGLRPPDPRSLSLAGPRPGPRPHSRSARGPPLPPARPALPPGLCGGAPGGLRPPLCALRVAPCAGAPAPARPRSGAARPPLVRRPGGPPAAPLGPCAPLCGSAGSRSVPLRLARPRAAPGLPAVALRSLSGSALRSGVRRGAPPPSFAARGSGPGASAALRAAPGGLRPRGPCALAPALACPPAGVASGGGCLRRGSFVASRKWSPCAPPPRRPLWGLRGAQGRTRLTVCQLSTGIVSSACAPVPLGRPGCYWSRPLRGRRGARLTRGPQVLPPVRSLATVPALLGAPPPLLATGSAPALVGRNLRRLATHFARLRTVRVISSPRKADPGPR